MISAYFINFITILNLATIINNIKDKLNSNDVDVFYINICLYRYDNKNMYNETNTTGQYQWFHLVSLTNILVLLLYLFYE